MSWLEQQLNIVNPQNWFKVSHEHLSKLGAASLLLKYGGMRNVLQLIYPKQNWDFLDGNRSTWLKSQNFLSDMVADILKLNSSDIKFNYKHPTLQFSQSTRTIELDIYIPSLSLAFEYQGEHHYHFHYLYGDPQVHQRRDQEKKRLCQSVGITLIEIPYWWNKEKQSLMATIQKFKPDLIKQSVTQEPIPETNPNIEQHQEKITFLLGLPWNDKINPTGWWIHANITGIRAMWNGKYFKLLNAMNLQLPNYFVTGMPDCIMDGVLK